MEPVVNKLRTLIQTSIESEGANQRSAEPISEPGSWHSRYCPAYSKPYKDLVSRCLFLMKGSSSHQRSRTKQPSPSRLSILIDDKHAFPPPRRQWTYRKARPLQHPLAGPHSRCSRPHRWQSDASPGPDHRHRLPALQRRHPQSPHRDITVTTRRRHHNTKHRAGKRQPIRSASLTGTLPRRLMRQRLRGPRGSGHSPYRRAFDGRCRRLLA